MKKVYFLLCLSAICVAMDYPEKDPGNPNQLVRSQITYDPNATWRYAWLYLSPKDIWRAIRKKQLEFPKSQVHGNNTPLEAALMSNDEPAVTWLLQQGAPVNATVLTTALFKRLPLSLLQKLVTSADRTIFTEHPELLFIALKREIKQLTYYPKEECCHSLNAVTVLRAHSCKTNIPPRPEVIELFLNHGSPIDAEHNGITPLSYALKLGASKNILETLLRFNPELNKPDKNNVYPLHTFLRKRLEMQELSLIKKLATEKNCNTPDRYGYKPLDLVRLQHDTQIRVNLQALLEKFGATPSVCSCTCTCPHCKKCPLGRPPAASPSNDNESIVGDEWELI